MNLNRIFDFQRKLMYQLAPVEQSLGYTPPQIPLDFATRDGQDWFRRMSWFLVEEIVEANTAQPDQYAEELADCLHFAVELCILAGVTPSDVKTLFQINLFDDVPSTYCTQDVINSLGMAVNLLKGKHWKKQFSPPNLPLFQTLLANMLFRLINIMISRGIDPEAEYFKKHKENEIRIATGY